MNDGADESKAGIHEKPRGSLAQIWPRLVEVVYVVLLGLGVIASISLANSRQDWVYYNHGGFPAPCSPHHTGYWPRDCH